MPPSPPFTRCRCRHFRHAFAVSPATRAPPCRADSRCRHAALRVRRSPGAAAAAMRGTRRRRRAAALTRSCHASAPRFLRVQQAMRFSRRAAAAAADLRALRDAMPPCHEFCPRAALMSPPAAERRLPPHHASHAFRHCGIYAQRAAAYAAWPAYAARRARSAPPCRSTRPLAPFFTRHDTRAARLRPPARRSRIFASCQPPSAMSVDCRYRREPRLRARMPPRCSAMPVPPADTRPRYAREILMLFAPSRPLAATSRVARFLRRLRRYRRRRYLRAAEQFRFFPSSLLTLPPPPCRAVATRQALPSRFSRCGAARAMQWRYARASAICNA